MPQKHVFCKNRRVQTYLVQGSTSFFLEGSPFLSILTGHHPFLEFRTFFLDGFRKRSFFGQKRPLFGPQKTIKKRSKNTPFLATKTVFFSKKHQFFHFSKIYQKNTKKLTFQAFFQYSIKTRFLPKKPNYLIIF